MGETGNVSVRERLHEELVARAKRIECVSNEIFTFKHWQLALNFILGVGALTLLIVAMVVDGYTVVATCTVVAIVLSIALVVFNLVLKNAVPMSIMQYTVVKKDRRYVFQIFGKTHSLYSDGERTVDVCKGEVTEADGVLFPQFAFDFFTNMSVDERIGKADREIYKGTLTIGEKGETGEKTVKCKIVFRNGDLYYGTVGGVRIKYFDVNDRKEKFAVPSELKRAADGLGIAMPKLTGVWYRTSN